MSAPAVSVAGLKHAYKADRQALKGVSFKVEAGETFGLLGPNGGGKSTIFRILSTYFPPNEGTVEILGETSPSAIRRRIGVVFQNPSLDAKLTVEENMRHQGRLYGVKSLQARIEEMLERYGLKDRRGDLAGSLSGGLRRRVELAKGLLHEPDLLLLDEPSTGLDPGARRELWSHLGELKRARKVTIVVTTHLMDEAEHCDRIVLLDQGQLVAEGTPAALKAKIGGDVVAVEAQDPEGLREKIASKFGLQPVLMERELRLEMKDGHTFIPQLIEAFPGAIESVSLKKPTLDDVFIHHTGRRL